MLEYLPKGGASIFRDQSCSAEIPASEFPNRRDRNRLGIGEDPASVVQPLTVQTARELFPASTAENWPLMALLATRRAEGFLWRAAVEPDNPEPMTSPAPDRRDPPVGRVLSWR